MSFLRYTACEVITSFPGLLDSAYNGDEVGVFRMYSFILTNSNHLCSNWFQLEDSVRGPFLSVWPSWLLPEASQLCSSTSLIKHTRPFIFCQLISLRSAEDVTWLLSVILMILPFRLELSILVSATAASR